MPILMKERVSLADAQVREVRDGYLVASPRVARTGVQLYLGAELGQPDRGVVRVYRPEDEVFRKDSIRTFAHRPVTDDHPPVPVTADNWREYSRGISGDEITRDGQFVRVPMMVMDTDLIRKVKDGKVELSVGYACNIEWESGVTDSGEKYDAVQRNIDVNHIAVVDAARGGKELRIGDDIRELMNRKLTFADLAVPEDADVFLDSGKKYPFAKGGTVYREALVRARDSGDEVVSDLARTILGLFDRKEVVSDDRKEDTMSAELKKVLIDGVTVEMTEIAQQLVDRQIRAFQDSVADLTKKLEDANAGLEALKKKQEEEKAKAEAEKANDAAKIAALETKVKDSEITPAKLDQMVKDREAVASKARSILSTVVVDGRTVGEIRRQVVDAKLGETAKNYTDDQVTVAFDTLTVGVQVESGLSDTARVFSTPPGGQDLSEKYLARDRRVEEAWKNPHGKA